MGVHRPGFSQLYEKILVIREMEGYTASLEGTEDKLKRELLLHLEQQELSSSSFCDPGTQMYFTYVTAPDR